jgi:predicted nucleic acid-binding protein
VASFFVNDDPVRVPRYEPHLLGRGIIVPFAAFAEMLFGAEVKNWGPARRADMSRFLRKGAVFSQRVCELWAEIRAAARRGGRPLPEQDAWMAAVAIYLDIPLVTHNARHYGGVPGLQVITEPDKVP